MFTNACALNLVRWMRWLTMCIFLPNSMQNYACYKPTYGIIVVSSIVKEHRSWSRPWSIVLEHHTDSQSCCLTHIYMPLVHTYRCMVLGPLQRDIYQKLQDLEGACISLGSTIQHRYIECSLHCQRIMSLEFCQLMRDQTKSHPQSLPAYVLVGLKVRMTTLMVVPFLINQRR